VTKSKPGIYEALLADGSKTRFSANSKTAARRCIGGRIESITRVADSWEHLNELQAQKPGHV
jgi:hypothetical protein